MSGPQQINGFRADGTHVLEAITTSIKEKIEDWGDPPIGPYAPFLTRQEYDRRYWAPEQIEATLLVLGLTLTFKAV